MRVIESIMEEPMYYFGSVGIVLFINGMIISAILLYAKFISGFIISQDVVLSLFAITAILLFFFTEEVINHLGYLLKIFWFGRLNI